MSDVLLFAGGGTGGHIFPLVAVAQAVRAIRPDMQIVFVGTPRGMESRVLGNLGEKLELLDILPIKGGGLAGALKGITHAALSLPRARELLKSYAPKAVLSIGGYAAGPVSLAARTMGIPVALLEPNSVFGLANRIMAPLAQRAYVAFPSMQNSFRKGVAQVAGVPLRHGFAPREYVPRNDVVRLLVLGGSQGALTLNQNLPRAIGIAHKQGAHTLRVVHQCGHQRESEVVGQYQEAGVMQFVTIVPFINDVPEAIADADLVVQRAGAGAIAEVCAIGRGSILIPYPFAAGNHQLHNALAMQNAGAAICVEAKDASSERLAHEILKLVHEPNQRCQMAKAAQSRGCPEASITIARDLLALAEAN